MGYNSDKYMGRGKLFLATNSDAPYCGFHHLFEMGIASDSPKTAGEVNLIIPENQPKTITP
jgi:hypothetical protein